MKKPTVQGLDKAQGVSLQENMPFFWTLLLFPADQSQRMYKSVYGCHFKQCKAVAIIRVF